MGWLSLCVNLIRLRDAQLAGKTLFLGLFVRMFLKAISIRFYRLSKEDSHSLVINPIYWDRSYKFLNAQILSPSNSASRSPFYRQTCTCVKC